MLNPHRIPHDNAVFIKRLSAAVFVSLFEDYVINACLCLFKYIQHKNHSVYGQNHYATNDTDKAQLGGDFGCFKNLSFCLSR